MNSLNHQESQHPLEHRRLLTLAREYRQKGYQVTLHPSPEELPPPLANHSIDLIAMNGTRGIAVRVRTRERLIADGCDELQHISEIVQQLPAWEFELVMTNPRPKND
jgi:hypothetical protein